MSVFDKVLRRVSLAVSWRPASHPFISGDTFRSFADHVFENGRLHSRNGVNKSGGIYFCETHRLEEFAKAIIPNIGRPFILISHNSDAVLREDHFGILESKLLVRWFAQNSYIQSQKVVVIPIGLENYWMRMNGKPSDYRQRGSCERSERMPRILYGFTIANNPEERQRAMRVLESSTFADQVVLSPTEYRKTLSNYMYVASPSGNGVDCHRTWEALYLGAIPIVADHKFYSQFVNFPGLVLSEWSDLLKFSQSDLIDLYNEKVSVLRGANYIWSDYWRMQIEMTIGR